MEEDEEDELGYGKVKSVTLREGDELPADLSPDKILHSETFTKDTGVIRIWYNAGK